jgi:hypothetical protein
MDATTPDMAALLSPRQAAVRANVGLEEIVRAMDAGELAYRFKGPKRTHRVICYANLLAWAKRDVREEMVERVMRTTDGGGRRRQPKLTLMVQG